MKPAALSAENASSTLPRAAFADPVVDEAIAALDSAGFSLVPSEHSAYFEASPQYAPTQAARERMIAEMRALGGTESLPGAQELQDRLFKSVRDVQCVANRFDLFEGDGEHEIGNLSVFEFWAATGIDEMFDRLRQTIEQRRLIGDSTGSRKSLADRDDLQRLCYFRVRRSLFMLRMWAPSDAEWTAVTAALEWAVGPAQTFE